MGKNERACPAPVPLIIASVPRGLALSVGERATCDHHPMAVTDCTIIRIVTSGPAGFWNHRLAGTLATKSGSIRRVLSVYHSIGWFRSCRTRSGKLLAPLLFQPRKSVPAPATLPGVVDCPTISPHVNDSAPMIRCFKETFVLMSSCVRSTPPGPERCPLFDQYERVRFQPPTLLQA